jgi:hypothetical protein
MLTQNWTKSLVNIALLMIAGAAALCCAQGHVSVNATLSGTLTDIRSAPLDNMTVTLSNTVTGVDVQTTRTSRGGHYRFTGLPAGEYTLTATGPRGTGRVARIFIAAAHEQHIQIAIELQPFAAESATLIAKTASPPAAAPPQVPPIALPHPINSTEVSSPTSVSGSVAAKPSLSANIAAASKTSQAEVASAPALADVVQGTKLGATHACIDKVYMCCCADSCTEHVRSAVIAIIGFIATTGATAVRPQLAKLRS